MRTAAASRRHVGPKQKKILFYKDFKVPHGCDTRSPYEAERFHLRIRRWSVER